MVKGSKREFKCITYNKDNYSKCRIEQMIGRTNSYAISLHFWTPVTQPYQKYMKSLERDLKRAIGEVYSKTIWICDIDYPVATMKDNVFIKLELCVFTQLVEGAIDDMLAITDCYLTIDNKVY